MTPERTLVTAGRAAQILSLADRRGVHWLVEEQLLEPFTGWTLEGVGKRRQLAFRLVDVRALLISRSERLKRRAPARWTAGSQLELVFPRDRVATLLPWLRKPVMAQAGLSLKPRLEREGRAKARLDGRPVKGLVNPRKKHRVA